MTLLVGRLLVLKAGKKSNSSSLQEIKKRQDREGLHWCFIERSFFIFCHEYLCAVAKDDGKYSIINLGFNPYQVKSDYY